jgi:purine-binding chemotaxis protein CheW
MSAQSSSSTPLALSSRSLVRAKEATCHYVIFRVDRQSYALHLKHVTRALRMVALTTVPDAPPWIMGVINLAGQIVPVLDLRLRLGLARREPELNDRILIVNTHDQSVAVPVDEVVKVLELIREQVEPPPPALVPSRPLAGTIQQADDLILVLEATRLLPLADSLAATA